MCVIDSDTVVQASFKCHSYNSSQTHPSTEHSLCRHLFPVYDVLYLTIFLSINSKNNSWNNVGKLQTH